MEQLRQLISQQAEALKRFESQSQQYVTQQHEEWTRKHHTQFQQFDGVMKDKNEVIQSLKHELANNQERHLHELDQALPDAERRAQQSTPMSAGTSTQPYATPVEKKTLTTVAAVAHAEAVPAFHSPGLSLGASAGNLNLKSNNKGSSQCREAHRNTGPLIFSLVKVLSKYPGASYVNTNSWQLFQGIVLKKHIGLYIFNSTFARH